MLNDVMLTRRGALTALSSSAATLVLSACSSSNDDEDSSIPTSVEYSMWDSGQQPAYQACADRFKEKTGITVNITQIGWNGYWTKLTAGFIAGTGPDAFADHIQKFAQLVDLDVLLPLEEQAAWVDVDVSAFQEGLLELWKGEDGHQYGCPKDWDIEAIFYNKDMAPSTGLSQEDMAGLEWNPDDGGTFEKALARLTVDVNGVRSDEPGFNPERIAIYGIGIQNSGDADGQTQWSPFTASTGDWYYTDKETWGTHYRYDDPGFQSTMDWYFGLVDKGFMNPNGAFLDATSTDIQMGSGKVAMAVHGAWMFTTFAKLDVNVGIVPTPVGLNGTSQSLYNGLGTRLSSSRRTSREPPSGWHSWALGRRRTSSPPTGSSSQRSPLRPVRPSRFSRRPGCPPPPSRIT